MDNIKEWTSLPMPDLLTMVSCRKDWKRISAESSLMSPDDPSSQGIELKPCMLLQRLINVQVNSDIVLWVRDVLLDRSQRISVNGQMSEDSEVNSGAPQCCVAPSFGYNTVNNTEHNQVITASNRHIATLIFQLFRPTCET